MSHDPATAGAPQGAGTTADTSQPQHATDATARIAELETRLAALEDEAGRARDQALRAMAEAENTRRRIQRDAEEREKFALSGFARELTSVVDNLRRALETLPADARAADGKLDQFAQGVELTEREFMAILDRNGIKRIHPQGQPFDHNLHQAGDAGGPGRLHPARSDPAARAGGRRESRIRLWHGRSRRRCRHDGVKTRVDIARGHPIVFDPEPSWIASWPEVKPDPRRAPRDLAPRDLRPASRRRDCPRDPRPVRRPDRRG
jgi:molecular chaperone GrpE